MFIVYYKNHIHCVIFFDVFFYVFIKISFFPGLSGGGGG